MKLRYLALKCLYATVFFQHTGSWTCNNNADLKIQVGSEIVTVIYPEVAVVSVYVNYPQAYVEVSYSSNSGIKDRIIDPVPGDPCRYDATYIGYNYNSDGLHITVTFYAKDIATDVEVSNSTLLEVQVKAEITSAVNRDGCRIPGENATLACEAKGNPIPSIAWLTSINADVVTTTNQPDFPNTVSATTELQLHNITFEDRGNYRCSVNNTVGNPPRDVDDVRNVNLEVNLPVVLVTWTPVTKVDYGSSATLSCTFQAYPLPDTTWSIHTSEGYKIEETDSGENRTTTLEIQNVTCDYITQYFCEASSMTCGNAEHIRSKSITVDITEPPSVKGLTAEIPDCDGTSVSLSWNKPDKWTDEWSYQVTGNSTDPPSILTTETIHFTNLSPKDTYEFQVTVVLCNVTSPPSTIIVTTADIGIPSAPVSVTQNVSSDYKLCTVTWIEPSQNYDSIENYEISYYTCEVNTNDCGESVTVNTSDTSYQINMTETPNSEYYVSVSARTCAGKGENATTNDIVCESDTAAPPSVAMPNPGNNSTSILTSSNTINVTIEPSDENSGEISCYFLVMIRYGSNPKRIELNSSYPVDQIAQADNTIEDNEPYFAIASKESGEFTVGNDAISQCSVEGTNSRTTSFTAKSRQLEFGRTYDMFVFSSVPSRYSDQVYYGVSDPVMITVSDKGTDVPVAAIVVPIVVVIGIIVGIGVWYYLKKHKKEEKDINMPTNSVAYHQEEVSANDYKYDKKQTPNFHENAGKSRVTPSPE